MALDHITSIIGQVGPFQLTWWTLMAYGTILHAMAMMSNKFLLHKIDFWCSRPDNYLNYSVAEWQNISAPLSSESDKFDRCQIFDLDYENFEGLERPTDPENTSTIYCTSWEYETSQFENGVIQRWDLVCDQSYLVTTSETLFFVGNLIGALVIGALADWYGRKLAYMLSITLWMAFGLGAYFSTNLYLWMVLRCGLGASSLAYHTASSIFSLELTNGKWRSFTNHIFGAIPWNVGLIMLGLVVFLVPNMKHVELGIALGAVPMMLLWYFMPESPRWLLGKGQKDKAEKVLKAACKINKRPFVSRVLDKMALEDATSMKKGSIWDLLRSTAIRRNSLCIFAVWFVFSFSYFGLMYHTPAFGWSMYLVFVFPPFIMIPMAIIQPFLENKLGRKAIMTFPLLLAGVALISTLAFRNGTLKWPVIVLSWSAICLVDMAFANGYTFTRELYPTSVRTTALAAASVCARFGAISAPYVALLEEYNTILPLIVYGTSLAFGGLVSLWIWPDTKNVKIMENLEECEQLASTTNSWLHPFKANKARRRPVNIELSTKL